MNEPMTDEELQACRERAEAATPGPWKVSRVPFDERKGTDEVCDLVNDTWVVTRVGFLRDFRSDAKFIAHAREDVPRLLATIDALKKDTAQISSEFGLPPAIRPAPGVITRLLLDCKALESRALKAEAELAELKQKKGWNACERCGHGVDAKLLDGAEVTCPACESVNVVNELTDGTFGLYLADFGEEDE